MLDAFNTNSAFSGSRDVLTDGAISAFERRAVPAVLCGRPQKCPEGPALSVRELQFTQAPGREALAFAPWNLKEKGLGRQNEAGDFEIPVGGADCLEAGETRKARRRPC